MAKKNETTDPEEVEYDPDNPRFFAFVFTPDRTEEQLPSDYVDDSFDTLNDAADAITSTVGPNEGFKISDSNGKIWQSVAK